VRRAALDRWKQRRALKGKPADELQLMLEAPPAPLEPTNAH
jgi:hypothetical protein